MCCCTQRLCCRLIMRPKRVASTPRHASKRGRQRTHAVVVNEPQVGTLLQQKLQSSRPCQLSCKKQQRVSRPQMHMPQLCRKAVARAAAGINQTRVRPAPINNAMVLLLACARAPGLQQQLLQVRCIVGQHGQHQRRSDFEAAERRACRFLSSTQLLIRLCVQPTFQRLMAAPLVLRRANFPCCHVGGPALSCFRSCAAARAARGG